jgi:WXXGXW repeat (2 copies)
MQEPAPWASVLSGSMNLRTNIPSRLAPPSATRSLAFGLMGALALFAGCSSEPDSHVVSAPPPPAPGTVAAPVTVTTQTTTTGPVAAVQPQPASTIVVTQAPPAAQAEVVLAQPTPNHVWIAGYWTWRDNQYEWMAGHWELPPSPNATWVAPRWEPENGAYRFYEGYWN